MAFSGFVENQYQPISEMYDGKSIFVTGSTGFLGKLFVEKILYRCPKIAKIYILVRDSQKISAREKLEEMLKLPIFQRLRDIRPKDLKKIILVTGDISKPNLGLEFADEKLLIENVSMVFHLAATTKFTEPLEVAMNINVSGTRRILELCEKMKNLQVLVYVSTAYSNADKKVIDEVVYPSPIPLSDIDQMMKQEEYTTEEFKKILNGLPNTYTLSKAVAENFVLNFYEHTGIRTIIVRPSAVTACKEEPVNGWIDNMYGATGFVTSTSKGLTRTLLADGNYIIDMIPADYVINVIVVAAARCERYLLTQHVEDTVKDQVMVVTAR